MFVLHDVLPIPIVNWDWNIFKCSSGLLPHLVHRSLALEELGHLTLYLSTKHLKRLKFWMIRREVLHSMTTLFAQFLNQVDSSLQFLSMLLHLLYLKRHQATGWWLNEEGGRRWYVQTFETFLSTLPSCPYLYQYMWGSLEGPPTYHDIPSMAIITTERDCGRPVNKLKKFGRTTTQFQLTFRSFLCVNDFSVFQEWQRQPTFRWCRRAKL